MPGQVEINGGGRAADEGLRVVRPLRLPTGPTGRGAGRGLHVGVALDVETTGLDLEGNTIIEIAARRFRYDADRVITDIDAGFQWREDPGVPLDPRITALTGLTDADLAGRRIDEEAATELLTTASFVVAHNAAFDRAWVERRLPDAAGLNWVCSMSQIDWRARGFDGRSLGYLLLQNGYFFGGHRAAEDVDALIEMLRHEDGGDRTALSELIDTGAMRGWIVRARGAHFDLKGPLRARGYRWDPAEGRRVWWREVADADLASEQGWLATHVYSPSARPKCICPEIVRVTPRSRFL